MCQVLSSQKPDLVLVQGDTLTAFATWFCAYYARIAVGHVEAGLRTGNMYAPYPEEMNRILVGKLAYFHFALIEGKKKLFNKMNKRYFSGKDGLGLRKC